MLGLKLTNNGWAFVRAPWMSSSLASRMDDQTLAYACSAPVESCASKAPPGKTRHSDGRHVWTNVLGKSSSDSAFSRNKQAL